MFTWTDASARWLQETEHKKSRRDDLRYAAWVAKHWQDKPLETIKNSDIRRLAELKKNESSAPTANRHLAFVRAVLNRAHREWEWITRLPYVRLYPEKARRVRWLDPEQVKILFDALPEHTLHAVIFDLSTGVRHSNVVGLRWDQIDLKRRVAWYYGDETKNGEDLVIPLNDSAMQVLELCKGRHPEYVFTFRGKPVKRLNTTAWNSAKKRANIENFRWHDLRHTWASWLVQNGTPLYALQELGGWKTVQMVRKYAHMSPAHNLDHARKIDAIIRPVR